jgi:hypothetical protein
LKIMGLPPERAWVSQVSVMTVGNVSFAFFLT